jgi:hypothetical protein
MDRLDLIDGLIDDAMSVLHHDGDHGDDCDIYERETLGKKFADRLGFAGFKFTPRIERNQIVTAPQTPAPDDRTLERVDELEAKDAAGPPVVFAAYKPPKDPRVQPLLKAAAAQRAAEGARAPPIATFTDPRLDPTYKPPKRPNQPR